MESLEDLATWRTQLIEEEEFITKLLAEIDEQINCLQVEQMELLNTMKSSEHQSRNKQKVETEPPVDKTSEKLDLTIPNIKNDNVEEEEEEEEGE